MPPALDRLLASPSALRLLRSIVNASEFPASYSASTKCCPPTAPRRNYSAKKGDQPLPFPKPKWRSMRQSNSEAAVRRLVRRTLQSDEANDASKPSSNLFQGNDTPSGKRPDDPALLAAILAYQERVHGAKGVGHVWRNINHDGHDLPTEDTPNAEYLWGTFIKHHLVVTKVLAYAEELFRETGKLYPRLYELAMTHWLPRNPQKALHYHHAMVENLKLNKLPLRALARSGRSTFKTAAYDVLMEIYKHSNERDLYDEVVPVLSERGGIAMAREWHTICTARNDIPSDNVALHPVIQQFTGQAPAHQTRSDPNKYDQKLMRRLSGPDTAPVRFEDPFVARMFATRTFPSASIIHGLSMVGINEIGPLALLTMARQTQPVAELKDRFDELREAGIALQGCVFSLALEKFVYDERWQLVHSMIESDQHPDVFGDAEVQRQLLEYYLDQGDTLQAQRTLAILTLFHKDQIQESWNTLLQVHIKHTGPQHVMEVLQDMRAGHVMLTRESIAAIRGLLRQRRIGHKPADASDINYDDLRFVTRTFVMILEAGIGIISPPYWREIIRRLGMLGRFRELRRLLLWLLCWYAPRSSFQFATLPKSPFLEPATAKLRTAYPERNHYFHFPGTKTQNENPFHPIRQIFKPSLIQGLIVWGFRAGMLPNAPLEQTMFTSHLAKKHWRRYLLRERLLKRLGWSIGLRTVVQLRELGVHVHHHTVLKALQMQLVVMFGHGHSKIVENRIVERTNIHPYAHYVYEVNKIWGSRLLAEPQLFATGMMHRHMWHPRLRRKVNRKRSLSLGEILGPNWQDRNNEWEVRNQDKVTKEDSAAALEQMQQFFKAQEKAGNLDLGSIEHSSVQIEDGLYASKPDTK
ncbi:hypothetical protein DDE82_001128 [Stemphylium lycopersici]|uniref:Uncharacterized protein n=1 Tax=Stemphylium lycopersici TaxID=183478 RepID=A0A364NBA2_STELY|nr:hypothetical protein DDE82_001128 [Stemphylium lycopersici]RAR14585.1 hypothetical protein DDE83_001984 [Stemphylium lycopersici]